MKKHELLKYAYDNYPKGTKFIGAYGDTFCSNGKIKFSDIKGDLINEPEGLIYDGRTNKWAKIVDTKDPLLVSEDGVELFDGDDFWSVSNKDWDVQTGTNKWEIKNSSGPHKLSVSSSAYKNSETKAFSKKQAALEWIDKMNKPKAIQLFHGMKCIIKEKVSGSHEIEIFDADNLVTVLSPSDIEDISHALKNLNNENKTINTINSATTCKN